MGLADWLYADMSYVRSRSIKSSCLSFKIKNSFLFVICSHCILAIPFLTVSLLIIFFCHHRLFVDCTSYITVNHSSLNRHCMLILEWRVDGCLWKSVNFLRYVYSESSFCHFVNSWVKFLYILNIVYTYLVGILESGNHSICDAAVWSIQCIHISHVLLCSGKEFPKGCRSEKAFDYVVGYQKSSDVHECCLPSKGIS